MACARIDPIIDDLVQNYKVNWNIGGVMSTKKPAVSLKWYKIGPSYYYNGLIGSRIRAFDRCQNQ